MSAIDELMAQIGPLKAGEHRDRDAMCIMEAVAFVAGEQWSYHPACASEVIGAFLRTWSDALDDETRDRLLRPLVPRLIGTAGDEAIENRRATMAIDWLVRVHASAWLRFAGLTVYADVLSALPEITDFATCPSLMLTLHAAEKDADAARDTAEDAARNAAMDAAWDAARAAVWAVARNAAWVAAGNAARAAAWVAAAVENAAMAAAGTASWVSAGDDLKEIVATLRSSALDLIDRMIGADD